MSENENLRAAKILAALKVIFQETGAEAIEIHSGDREPGQYVSRENILGKKKAGTQ